MDIEYTLSPSKPFKIFSLIAEFPVSSLYQQQITLENTFTSQKNTPQHDILLTLINNTLLISNPFDYQIQPYAALDLAFDIKFQIIYEVAKNVVSRKIGIRIYGTDKESFEFFSNENYIIETWVVYLSKKINQKGFHEMFKPLKKLGKGNFASVYEVQRLTDGMRFAVKAFSKQSCFSAKNGKESLINELAVMRQLNMNPHPHVLKLEAVFQSQNSIYVVLQLLTGGPLFHKIQQQNGYFSTEEIKKMVFGLLSGLNNMHEKRIMHRDLKPQNIMLRENGSFSPVIVDFGLATPVDAQKYLFFRCGTPGYVAPQIIELNQSKHIEPECDIFSIGVIFHILLTRKAVFEGSKYEQVYKKNKEMKILFQGQKYDNLDPVALDLMKNMLLANPQQRLKASEALNHPYFENLWPVQQTKVYSPCVTNASQKKKIKNLVSKK